MFELMAALVALLAAGPLVFGIAWLAARLRSRRQIPSHVRGTEPAGDPSLRAALAAARRAAHDEQREWEAEFCKALGVDMPSNSDPYNLAEDMQRLQADILETGSLYGADAVKYLLIMNGMAQAAAPHRDIPTCRCKLCNEKRKALFRGTD